MRSQVHALSPVNSSCEEDLLVYLSDVFELGVAELNEASAETEHTKHASYFSIQKGGSDQEVLRCSDAR